MLSKTQREVLELANESGAHLFSWPNGSVEILTAGLFLRAAPRRTTLEALKREGYVEKDYGNSNYIRYKLTDKGKAALQEETNGE